MRPHLTLGWLTLINATPFEVVTAAANAGFKSVSIRITGRRIAEPYAPIVGNKAALQDLRTRLADGGTRLSNISSYHLSPDVTIEDMLPVFDAGQALGAEFIVATCMDPDHARWVGFMATYCEAAGKAGLRVAFEFVPYSAAKTIEVADDIVQRTGAPNFGLLIDSLHLSRSGGTPADIGNVDPARIVLCQICDAVAARPPQAELPVEARTGRLYPGMGALPLGDFLDALPSGIEIELEAPQTDYAKLSPDEQAKRAGDATRAFLDAYARKSGRPLWN